jgi:hypothetical protein
MSITFADVDNNSNGWITSFLKSNNENTVNPLQDKITAIFLLKSGDLLHEVTLTELEQLSLDLLHAILTIEDYPLTNNRCQNVLNVAIIIERWGLLDEKDKELFLQVIKYYSYIFGDSFDNYVNNSSSLSVREIISSYIDLLLKELENYLPYKDKNAYVSLWKTTEATNFIKNKLSKYGFKFINIWDNADLVYKARILNMDWKSFSKGQIINHLPNGPAIYNKLNLFYNLIKSGPKSYLPLTLPIEQSLKYKNYLLSWPTDSLYLLKASDLDIGTGISLHHRIFSINKNDKESIEFITKGFTDRYYYKYLIQQYIMNPLLYNGRKFHIRVASLAYLNHVYIQPHPYIILSTHQYTSNIDNYHAHITNTINSADSSVLLEEAFPQLFPFLMEKIIDIIKDVFKNINVFEIDETMFSPIKGIPFKMFEIYGIDFIVDENYNLFLLEINTNPGLHDSGIYKVDFEDSNFLTKCLEVVLLETPPVPRFLKEIII